MFAQPQRVHRAVEQHGQIMPGLLPSSGINVRDPVAKVGPEFALDLINVITTESGLSTRYGYAGWAWDLPGNLSVPTIMSYYPAIATPSGVISHSLRIPSTLEIPDVVVNGQLFACTNNNIYDITAGGGGPWVGLTDGAVTSDYWTWRNFQNAAGSFLLACNYEGGYYAYGAGGFSDGFSDGFATLSTGFAHIMEGDNIGQITGIDPDLFVFLMVWKRRLWFVEKNSTRSWYLPVEQITGQASLFDFGTHFRHGGYLVALVNWTLDGGEGIDDYLVAVGSEGDIVIFKGYDPDSAAEDPNAFSLHGIWYVGPLPAGRRQVDLTGGDVWILSVRGLTPLSKLVQGSAANSDPVGGLSDLVNPLISRYMKASNRSQEWYIKVLPREEMAVVGLPRVVVREGVNQLALRWAHGAWSKLADLPILSYTNHSDLIFGGGDPTMRGDAAGRVYLMFSNQQDNAAGKEEGANRSSIRCRVVPAYNGFGAPGLLKSYPMVRPMFLAQIVPQGTIKILTDYVAPEWKSVPTLPVVAVGIWDTDLWDVGEWGGPPYPIRRWLGTVGAGFAATAQFDYIAIGGLTLASIDWWVKGGGPL